jgi:DNA (cytosine-5)-methyltransferase 1
MLTVGSLFSGIGGLDLGLERAGMQVIWQSEIDPYACKVLKKHWPEVPNHGNIKEIDWRNIVRPDVICGGYPCQPFSQAGKRQGEKDERHLWPWVKDAISVLRPRYAILENVRGHLTLGGTTVIGELAEIGYDAEWRIVSAASVGANHRRDRIIIVAYPNSQNEPTCAKHEQRLVADTDSGRREQRQPETQSLQGLSRSGERATDMADADGERLERPRPEQQTTRVARSREESGRNVANTDLRETSGGFGWNGTDRSAVFGGEHQRRGTAGYAGREWWQVEPGMGRVANGVSNRVDRLRGLGNAVVPQVAEVIGRIVVDHAQHN